jgi:hypothetical protein
VGEGSFADGGACFVVLKAVNAKMSVGLCVFGVAFVAGASLKNLLVAMVAADAAAGLEHAGGVSVSRRRAVPAPMGVLAVSPHLDLEDPPMDRGEREPRGDEREGVCR